ncbi:MAG: 2-phospho-L-lactate guanylyltransferase [Blastomonas sp.]
MSINIIIPVRSPAEGKSRLAGVLDAGGRAAIVEQMFLHVLEAALGLGDAAHCHVVSSSSLLLERARQRGANGIHETVSGLNPALTEAASRLEPDRPVMALHADLPLLEADDLACMIEALSRADVVTASDHAGLGTNALLLRRPNIIPFAFGVGSLARHQALAGSAGLRCVQVSRRGLSTDIDEPADLARFQRLQAAA